MDIWQWQKTGQQRQLDEHSLFCIDTGEQDRPAILLIHGFPTASWDWFKIWPALHQHYRLLAIDMLGFGFSDKPNPHHYSIHEQADLQQRFLADAGIARCHVLAHDYGDTVAQELLARHEETPSAQRGCEFLSICFLNGGLFPETHHALFTQKLLLSPLGPLVNRLAGKAKFESSVCKVFGENSQPSQFELDSFWQLVNYNKGKHLFHNLITYMRDRREHRERWVSVLQQAQLPLALINGSADPVSGAHMVERYRELGCRLDFFQELAEIGHYPQVEAPEEVAAAYLAFLAQLDDLAQLAGAAQMAEASEVNEASAGL